MVPDRLMRFKDVTCRAATSVLLIVFSEFVWYFPTARNHRLLLKFLVRSRGCDTDVP